MLFPSFRQQQPLQSGPQGQGNPPSLSSLGWLTLLPGLILLLGSPALAQLPQSRGISDPGTPVTAKSIKANATSLASNHPPEAKFAVLELTPPNAPKQSDNPSQQRQVRASLDSPPSPEIAATLCDGKAQNLSGPVIITSQTVCQSGLTPPSLWWTQEQVAQELRTSGKLVNDWSAQLKTADAPGQVRLIVNPQMWSLMDYFERYDFVSNFGLAARDFGYQTEVYNTKGTRLASYICQVQETPENLGSHCKMNLGSSLNFSSRGSRNGLL